MPDLRRRLSWWPYALVLALVAPLVFVNLGAFPLRLWDESRLAINALQMRDSGDWIVTGFDGHPDMWNTKPPLLIWIQVAAMDLLGPGDLVLRLPSALAALATCLLLLALGRRFLRDTGFGLLGALVLATSPGFMGLHAARTADYDALMTLLTTAAGVAFFLFLETGRGRWLLAFCLAQALGLLTKGVGAALFLPALAVYALLRGRTGALLRDRRVYLGAAGVALIVGGYYLLREHHNPGYLAAVYDNELGGRYLQAIEGHGHPASFYVSHLWHTRLPLWSALVPAGLATALRRRRNALGRLAGYAALLAISYLAIISGARTKLLWYDVPAYPWLALLVAAFLRTAAGWFLALPLVAGRPRWRPVPVLLLGALLARPYLGVLGTVRGPDPEADRYRLGYALKEALDHERDLDGAFLLIDGYAPHCDFYVRLLRSRGVTVGRKDWRALAAGDVVLAQDPAICAYLHQNYAFEVREDRDGLLVCRITAGRGS